MINSYPKILITLNVVLVIFNITLLSIVYFDRTSINSEGTTARSENAASITTEESAKKDEQARKRKLNSALGKLSNSGEESIEANPDTQALITEQALTVQSAVEEYPTAHLSDGSELEAAPVVVDQAQLERYKTQADAYKKSLEAVAPQHKAS